MKETQTLPHPKISLLEINIDGQKNDDSFLASRVD